MLQAVIIATAVFVLWRLRVIQVAAFLTAAGIGGSRRARKVSKPGNRATDWCTYSFPSTTTPPRNRLALVSYHAEYHGFDPRRASESLMAATRLGVGWIRTDLRWREILPDGKYADPKALAWYRSFLSAASDYGLRNMVVLSTPPDPVLKQRSSQRLDPWRRFIEIVVKECGRWCDSYQMMNEPNNPIYRFFSTRDAADAVICGASIIHASAPLADVAINVSIDIWGWRKYLETILKQSKSSVNTVGIDHYPGTWTVGFHERWAEVMALADAISSAKPGSPWFKRRLAIMETGFSTNSWLRDEPQQTAYFESIAKVTAHLKHRLGEAAILGIYELCDADSSGGLDPEAHFGLLTTDLKPKRAFEIVRRIVTSL